MTFRISVLANVFASVPIEVSSGASGTERLVDVSNVHSSAPTSLPLRSQIVRSGDVVRTWRGAAIPGSGCSGSRPVVSVWSATTMTAREPKPIACPPTVNRAWMRASRTGSRCGCAISRTVTAGSSSPGSTRSSWRHDPPGATSMPSAVTWTTVGSAGSSMGDPYTAGSASARSPTTASNSLPTTTSPGASIRV